MAYIVASRAVNPEKDMGNPEIVMGPRHMDVPSVLAAQEAAASHSAKRSHTKWLEGVETNLRPKD